MNFGHTIGHAVEHLSGYALLHGEAVAIGMVAEARLGELAEFTLPGLADEVRDLCLELGLPVSIDAAIDTDAIVELTRSEKKARSGAAQYALPMRLGEMNAAGGRFSVPVEDALVREAIRAVR